MSFSNHGTFNHDYLLFTSFILRDIILPCVTENNDIGLDYKIKVPKNAADINNVSNIKQILKDIKKQIIDIYKYIIKDDSEYDNLQLIRLENVYDHNVFKNETCIIINVDRFFDQIFETDELIQWIIANRKIGGDTETVYDMFFKHVVDLVESHFQKVNNFACKGCEGCN